MDVATVGRALETALKGRTEPITVADAATAGGLPLRDAARGLQWLMSEYRGHLRVTEDGDLLYVFPTGFTKPWVTNDAIDRALTTVANGGLGIARFVVRAWVMVVLLAYVAIFLAVLLGLSVSRGDDRRDSGIGGGLAAGLFRVLADALFWTFHPFSPFAYSRYGGSRWERTRDETPFYEKVNRFFFGPTPPPQDPRAMTQLILGELRAQKGRIGVGDVMRVTGLPRNDVDPLMAKLMLDYEGDVSVSEDGGIFYHFEAMRKTTSAAEEEHSAPAWERFAPTLPFTGNTAGSNLLIGALNLFNLVMGFVAIDMNLTLAKFPALFDRKHPFALVPHDGTPLVLGVIPIVFSILMFALPLFRVLARWFKARSVAKERGRLTMLRTVLAHVQKPESRDQLTEEALAAAWTEGAGTPPLPEELRRRVVDLGGDIAIDENTGATRYRFVDLEAEADALETERAQASEEEKRVGRVVFRTDD